MGRWSNAIFQQDWKDKKSELQALLWLLIYVLPFAHEEFHMQYIRLLTNRKRPKMLLNRNFVYLNHLPGHLTYLVLSECSVLAFSLAWE